MNDAGDGPIRRLATPSDPAPIEPPAPIDPPRAIVQSRHNIAHGNRRRTYPRRRRCHHGDIGRHHPPIEAVVGIAHHQHPGAHVSHIPAAIVRLVDPWGLSSSPETPPGAENPASTNRQKLRHSRRPPPPQRRTPRLQRRSDCGDNLARHLAVAGSVAAIDQRKPTVSRIDMSRGPFGTGPATLTIARNRSTHPAAHASRLTHPCCGPAPRLLRFPATAAPSQTLNKLTTYTPLDHFTMQQVWS